MHALAHVIPEADIVLAFEPEELGSKLLFLLRQGGLIRNGIFHPGNLANEASGCHPSPYPGREAEICLALAEAFAWLEAQGLIVPAAGSNGSSGFRRLSRRAHRFESESEFEQYAIARQLSKKTLNPRIADKVWMAFMRGEFDVAVFLAMKAVEVAVKSASGIDELGVRLMRAAFRPNEGPLTDCTTDVGEQEARMQLFVGAIGSFKNPQSHRDVPLESAMEATEVILFANHLLRIVDSRKPIHG